MRANTPEMIASAGRLVGRLPVAGARRKWPNRPVGPSTPVLQALLSAAPPDARALLAALPDLDAAITALVVEGRVAWPGVRVAPEAVAAFVGRHLTTADANDDVLGGLRGADLYLAAACAAGDTNAIGLFDKLMMGEVDIALARMRITGARLADVKQLVRQRLFVGNSGGTGKIVEYGGRGDLRRWVRSVAVRTCLNELRRNKREVLSDDQVLAQNAVAGDDPQMQYMKQTYAGEFKQAFGVALAGLGAREQTLLRYHHVDGLNIDEIGAIYRVHRVTAFRWLEKAKEQLVKVTLEQLRARLKVTPGELDSVLRMIQSQVHLSLIRNLGGPSDRIENDVIAPDDEQELDISELEEV